MGLRSYGGDDSEKIEDRQALAAFRISRRVHSIRVCKEATKDGAETQPTGCSNRIPLLRKLVRSR
jgi:hypothetical protein